MALTLPSSIRLGQRTENRDRRMERSHWRTVSLVTGWQVAASLCYYTVFAATPFFRSAFGLSRFEVGIVVTILTLGYATFLLPLGAATDRYGEGTTLTFGLVGLAAGVVLVASVSSYAFLLAAVFVLGSAYGTAMPGTNKAIFDNISPGRQNFAMGIKQVGVTGGSGLSALLVTGLAGAFFWEAGFFLAAAVGILVAAAFHGSYIGKSDGEPGTMPDFRGLLSNSPYRALVAAGVFLGAVLFTSTGYTVLYVEESIGSSVVFGGIVLASVQLFGSLGRVLSGWFADALSGRPRVRITAILVVQTLGSAVLLAAVGWTSTPLGALITFSALGFFALGFTGVYYSSLATLVSVREMGGATAGGQLALTAGALVAPPIFGRLADTVGYRTSWLFLASGAVVAAVLLLWVIYAEPPVEQPAAAE